MKTAITSKITLLNILRSRSTLILIALGFMVFVLAQRTQAVNAIVIYCYPSNTFDTVIRAIVNRGPITCFE